jgi:predicted aspartyl protease
MPTTRISMVGPTDMISSIGPYGKNENVILQVKIKGKDEKEHTTTAMIDCGAMENFIDRQFAEQQQLPLTKKAVPPRVLAVDERLLVGGPITHKATVTLTINDYREEIKLHCITIGNSPIIIGLPWLRKHNPNINWKEGRITFDSQKCGKTCLAASPHATMITEIRVEAEYEQSAGRSL